MTCLSHFTLSASSLIIQNSAENHSLIASQVYHTVDLGINSLNSTDCFSNLIHKLSMVI